MSATKTAASARQGEQDTVRTIRPEDAPACGRIIYEAFKEIAERHAFPPDFPSVEAGVQLAHHFSRHPEVYGVVVERGGRVVGSNFLDERSVIRGVGPITVEPACQQGGVGRRLMDAVLERGSEAEGIRLVQDAFNMASYSLYTSLGFDAKEPLILMQGKPTSGPRDGYTVRPLQTEDLDACSALCTEVHGLARTGEVRDALSVLKPFAAFRGGSLRAYASAVTFWPLNHAVAETEEDLQALLLGAAAAVAEPLSFLVPTRRSGFFRWCLREGFRSVKPMTLMALGRYHEPQGAFYPSVMF